MDKLDQMFCLQKNLQLKIGYNPEKYNIEYFNLMFIGCITELCEAIEQTKWKPWKKSARTDLIKVRKELIDVWHFLINLSIASGLTPDKIFEEFCMKNKINNGRQNNGY